MPAWRLTSCAAHVLRTVSPQPERGARVAEYLAARELWARQRASARRPHGSTCSDRGPRRCASARPLRHHRRRALLRMAGDAPARRLAARPALSSRVPERRAGAGKRGRRRGRTPRPAARSRCRRRRPADEPGRARHAAGRADSGTGRGLQRQCLRRGTARVRRAAPTSTWPHLPERDFAAIFAAMGGRAETIAKPDDLCRIGSWLRDRTGPLLLDCKVSRRVVAPWLRFVFGGDHEDARDGHRSAL